MCVYVYVCVWGGGGEAVYNDILMHNLFEWSVTDSLHCIDIRTTSVFHTISRTFHD